MPERGIRRAEVERQPWHLLGRRNTFAWSKHHLSRTVLLQKVHPLTLRVVGRFLWAEKADERKKYKLTAQGVGDPTLANTVLELVVFKAIRMEGGRGRGALCLEFQVYILRLSHLSPSLSDSMLPSTRLEHRDK